MSKIPIRPHAEYLSYLLELAFPKTPDGYLKARDRLGLDLHSEKARHPGLSTTAREQELRIWRLKIQALVEYFEGE